MQILLAGCFEDKTITKCKDYSEYLEGMILLLRTIDSQILYSTIYEGGSFNSF